MLKNQSEYQTKMFEGFPEGIELQRSERSVLRPNRLCRLCACAERSAKYGSPATERQLPLAIITTKG